MPALGRDHDDVAALLGLSPGGLSDLLGGRLSVMPELADLIGELAGNGGGLWLRLQENYDARSGEFQKQ